MAVVANDFQVPVEDECAFGLIRLPGRGGFFARVPKRDQGVALREPRPPAEFRDGHGVSRDIRRSGTRAFRRRLQNGRKIDNQAGSISGAEAGQSDFLPKNKP